MTVVLWDVNRFLGRWPTAELAYHDLAGLLADMDRLGIARAVVSHTDAWQHDPTTGNARLTAEIETASEEVRNRLLPCWVIVPPVTREQGTPEELADALDRHAVRFARLCPRDHNYSLVEPDAAEMLDLLERRRTIALIDADQTSWEEIDRVAAAHPQLSIIVCRTGYRSLRRMAGVLERRPNCFIDLSYFGSHQGVEWLVERFGKSRLIFGTGAPLVDGGGGVTRLLLAEISDEARSAIGQGNLSRSLAHISPEETTENAVGDDSPMDSAAWAALARGRDVIDAHAHVGPWYNFFTPEPDATGMMRAMDRCGIQRAAISSMLAIGPDARAGNRETLEVVRRHPDRFVGYAVFNPHHHDNRADVERMLQEPGIVGIKIHPVTHEYPLGGPDYEAVWELASRFDVPVLTHTEAGSAVSDPALIDDVATRWPNARIILGHAGVTDAGHRTAISLAREHSNLYLELCGSFITGVWIQRMVDAIGPERVLYGSDFPFIDLRYSLGRVLFAGLPPADLDLVLGGNARCLLKLRDDEDGEVCTDATSEA